MSLTTPKRLTIYFLSPFQHLTLRRVYWIVNFNCDQKRSLFDSLGSVVVCDNEENSLATITAEVVPLKMDELDGSCELLYNASGKISRLYFPKV